MALQYIELVLEPTETYPDQVRINYKGTTTTGTPFFFAELAEDDDDALVHVLATLNTNAVTWGIHDDIT